MSLPSSVPAAAIYSIEHVSTVPTEQWHAFVLAVTEVFWQLPSQLRPGNQERRFSSMLRSSELFPEPGILAFCCSDPFHPVSFLVEQERSRDVISMQELDFQRQPCDFFARVVMVLLHNLCPDHYRIHSSLGGSSWALPVLWAQRHLNMALKAPQQMPVSAWHKQQTLLGKVSTLLMLLLSDSDRWINPTHWRLIAETEACLYQVSE